MKNLTFLIVAVCLLCSFSSKAQIKYQLVKPLGETFFLEAFSEPDSTWMMPNFDHSSWKTDSMSVMGYGYEEYGYIKTDPKALSVYLRRPFTIESKELIRDLSLMVDYDDGYVAYINGVEVARVNVDLAIKYPPFDVLATRSHASELASKLTRPVLGVYIDQKTADSCLTNGLNVLAIHFFTDKSRANSLIIPYLYDLTNYNYNWIDDLGRFKRLIPVDSTNLPLVVLETDQYGIPYNQSKWTIAKLGIVDNGKGRYNCPTDSFNVYKGDISIRSRGQSSRDFEKKSYRFELIDSIGTDTTVSLLGMPKESDWILSGPYADKSQIRNKFLYDLSSRIGQYAPRTRFCELQLNGESEGLYTITEQIKRDKNRVDISKITDKDIAGFEVTGGYIFKFDKTDPNMKTIVKQREIVYPDVLQPEQITYLTRFFTVYDSILLTNNFADPQIGFRKYASDSSLVDFLIINEIAKNADAYLFSTYMHKDRDDKDGRMKFGPVWDYDIALGNSIFQGGNEIEGWQFEVNQRMRITRFLQDRKLVELFQNRWGELRQSVLSNDSIFGYMNELIAQISEVRQRNYQVWPIIDKVLFYPGYNVDSYENEILSMQSWLTNRLDWIDNNIGNIFYKMKFTDTELLSSNVEFKAYPNPFTNELKFTMNTLKKEDVRVEIYNLYGQLIITKKQFDVEGFYEFSLNENELSTFQKGVYFAKLYINGIPIKTEKVLKR